jgi:prepilin-type processing-associated H-X9-DG protein/prepilin-type N-terminal cleavage/methylation domain-containing protein
MSRQPSSRANRGVTLLELLVVVAVLAVLMALLLPALAQAKARSKSVQCVSQLRQLGLGLQMYSESDSLGRLPPDPRGDNAPAWVMNLTPYLGSVEGIRLCPADPLREARRQWKRTSYVRNEYTAREHSAEDPLPPTAVGPDGRSLIINPSSLRVANYRRPSETFLAFEVSNQGVLFPPVDLNAIPVPAFDDHTHPDTWIFGWAHVLADIDPYRHGRSANYLFADGHVAAVPAVVLRERLERGENFAALPE